MRTPAACPLALACAVLIGCETPHLRVPGAPPADATAPSELPAEVVGPDLPPLSDADRAATVARLPAPLPPRRPPHPPPPVDDIDPAKLLGLSPAQVAQLVGLPESRTDNPPSTIWRYTEGECALDVFFYLELDTQTFRVLTYDLRSEPADGARARACFGRIRAARQSR